MGLPDRNSASTWGGKLLVDRDGTEIGTCTQVFVDDATGLPEWAEADLSGGPVVVPLLDAAEAGDRVRVAVRQVDVAQAPRVDDPGHISEDEEERLYRHYGIRFSREESDSLLPVGPLEPPDEVVTPESAPLTSGTDAIEALGAPDTVDPAEQTGRSRRGLVTSLAAGVAGAVAAALAVVLWWRQRHQAPPSRKDLLAARARAASRTFTTRRERMTTSAAPLLMSGRERSAVAARRAAEQARVQAERATVQARVQAERAAVQGRAAARQAAALAATARTLRLQRVPSDADLEQQAAAAAATAGGRGRARVLGLAQTVAGFAAGYAVRARSGGGRHEAGDEATAGERRPFQQVAGRVQGRVTETLRTGSQRAGAVAGKIRHRSDGGDPA